MTGWSAQSDVGLEQAAGLDPTLAELVSAVMKRYVVPGLALGLVSGGHEWLRGFGVTSVENPLPIDANTIFVAGSITKTVIATSVACLVDRQQLDLDLPVRRYLPDLRLADESVASAVTLRHLMTHTAGWVGDDLEEDDTGLGDDALARAIESFRDRPQIFPLGSVWSYNNSAFWLAGRVIEMVTRKSLEPAITELLFQPLGMRTSFFFEADAITRRCAVGHIVGDSGELTVARPWSTTRAHHAAGGMLTTIADLMTYARFHLGDGHGVDGTQVLSAEALRSMREPLFPAAGSESAGIGWVVRDLAGHRVLSHGGDWNGQQALLTLVPDRGLAIGTLANSGQARLANDAIASWALRRYLGAAFPEPVPVEREDERLNALVGRYALPGKAIEIAREGTRLEVRYFPSVRPGINNSPYLEQSAALTTEGRIVVLEGPFEGVMGDFSIGPNESVEWVRFGGRVYPREGQAAN